MALAIGIIGLPNVGKSTLFSALTKKQVSAENYPFCTIDPNVGVVAVPDVRLAELARVCASREIIPTVIEFVDIAGLVKGASKGEGLGNKFLSHIREVDAIVHVVRTFTDPNVIHVDGSVDPKRDEDVILLELLLSDEEVVKRRMHDLGGKAKSGDKESIGKLAMYEKIAAAFRDSRPASSVSLNEEEQEWIREVSLLTLKPILVVENVAEEELITPSPRGALRVSAKIEAELAQLPDDEAREYLRSLSLDESGLDRLIKASYKLLDLLTFFTAGEKETRAWTVQRGAKAPEAAGKIHTDFEQGFIRAEVVEWKDLVECNGYAGARDKGRLRMEGKDYVMQDGDVVHFHFN